MCPLVALAVGHADSHSACPMAKAIRNAQADITAVTRRVTVWQTLTTMIKPTAVQQLADETEKALTQASNLDQRTTVLALRLCKC